MERRNFLALVLGYPFREQEKVHPALLALQASPEQPSDSEKEKITGQFLDVARKIGGNSTVGQQIGEPYLAEDGLIYCTLQRVRLQLYENGEIQICNLIEDLSDLKHKGLLQFNKLKDILPTKAFLPPDIASSFDKRVELFEIPTQFVDWVNILKEMGFDPGMPIGRAVDYKTKDGQTVYSLAPFQKIILHLWNDGGKEIVLTSELLKEAGMLPTNILLPAPKSIDIPRVPNQTSACSPGIEIARGNASYYERNKIENGVLVIKCVGCRPDYMMAIGRPLDDGFPTIAYNGGHMGRWVRVTNIDNGLWTVAQITDTGGFGRYGKVADLNLATRNNIGGGHNTRVIVELLNC